MDDELAVSPDQINAAFEFAGALLTFRSAWLVARDGGYAGVSPGVIAFFFSWGLWNLYFYPSVNSLWSFHAGLVLVAANLSWIMMMLWFGKVERAKN